MASRMARSKGLLAIVRRIRHDEGHVPIPLYNALVRKARNKQELEDVVHDFALHFPKPNAGFLGAAASTAARLKPPQTALAASLLARVPPGEPLFREVVFGVLNKAAEEGDGASARLAFGLLASPKLEDQAALLAAHTGDLSAQREMLEAMVSGECPPDTDQRVLGRAVKFAARMQCMGLAERVWAWGLPVRDRLLCKGTESADIAHVYAQYVTACARAGRLDLALAAWRHWCGSDAATTSASAQPKVVLRCAVITALASHGRAEEAEAVYSTAPAPNLQMLTSLLNAFSHAGLHARALDVLRQEAAGPLRLDVRAFTAAVDACARQGRFDLALEVIDNDMRRYGVKANDVTWMAVLGPCRNHPNLQVAAHAFARLRDVSTDPERLAAAFIVMGDVHRALGQPDKAAELDSERRASRLWKQRGAVEVTVGDQAYTFHVGTVPPTIAHMRPAIDAKLAEWEQALASSGVEVESIRNRHSEKLALAFAVLSGVKDITLTKNLRVCAQCHAAALALTLSEGITVRHKDTARVHVMRDGLCSCGGQY